MDIVIFLAALGLGWLVMLGATVVVSAMHDRDIEIAMEKFRKECEGR